MRVILRREISMDALHHTAPAARFDKPTIGVTIAPSQIRKNCRTSLNMADRKPPSATYIATVRDETQMLKLMSQPRITLITTAIAYILTPLIKIVMKPKVMAESARAGSPNRNFK